MKNKKANFALVLCLLGFVACGKNNGDANSSKNTVSPAAVAQKLFDVKGAGNVNANSIMGVWGGDMEQGEGYKVEGRFVFAKSSVTAALRCRFFDNAGKIRKDLFAMVTAKANVTGDTIHILETRSDKQMNGEDGCEIAVQEGKKYFYNLHGNGKLTMGGEGENGLVLGKIADGI